MGELTLHITNFISASDINDETLNSTFLKFLHDKKTQLPTAVSNSLKTAIPKNQQKIWIKDPRGSYETASLLVYMIRQE